MISFKIAPTICAVNRSVALWARGQATVAVSAAKMGSLRSYEEIPGPKPLPVIGNAWRFLPRIGTIDMTDMRVFASKLRAEYGDIVKIANIPGRKDMLMLFDPDMIAEVFRNEGQWPERVAFESFKQFRLNVRPDFFEGNAGIANENGPKWQAARSVINQPMMRVNVSNLYVPKSDMVAKDFVKRVMKRRGSNLELPEDTKNDFKKWALESIALIALDARLGCLEDNLAADSDAQRLITAVENVIQLSMEIDFNLPIWKIYPTPTLKKCNMYQEELLNVTHKYVQQAKSKIKDLDAPETPDMSVLHRILKRDPSVKRAVIMGMDILMAGVDTTSAAAATTLYYLAANPETQEKLYQEVKANVPADPDQLITAEHLENMKFLRACLKESARLVPVAFANLRIMENDIALQNYHIPKGKADIMMFNGNMCLDEKNYPQAEKFIPERWLREEREQCPVKKAHETHPYVYMPFGHGVRACPGKRFANMEIETLIARMLLQFKLEWHQPDMTFSCTFMQQPSAPLKFTLIDRN